MIQRHNIFGNVWLMDKQYATNYYPRIYADMMGESNTQTHNSDNEDNIITNDSQKNILKLNITGAITKRNQYCGPRGATHYADLLNAAYNTPTIDGILIMIESGGGEGNAMRILQEALSQRNKPVIAYIDDMACSAAYGIASATDYIVANSELSRIGSIGVYLSIADYTEYYKRQGIHIREIYAPQSKDKNRDYLDAISGNTRGLEEQASRYAQHFIETIASQRNLHHNKEEWATGKTFFADQAQSIGLIDAIDTYKNVINYF